MSSAYNIRFENFNGMPEEVINIIQTEEICSLYCHEKDKKSYQYIFTKYGSMIVIELNIGKCQIISCKSYEFLKSFIDDQMDYISSCDNFPVILFCDKLSLYCIQNANKLESLTNFKPSNLRYIVIIRFSSVKIASKPSLISCDSTRTICAVLLQNKFEVLI